ncbi:hypothetical protein H2200_010468 [Cladophialophora chaetospira]|uniref:Acyltransferase 3 domain-containing protein n=1 Tax=Cladophialophora chaetospira TaxID=386627 RepID=A0AA39CE90_9EURO|nr:hypothetical protein H2200_010468 [Cladophialophora chaetospira]
MARKSADFVNKKAHDPTEASSVKATKPNFRKPARRADLDNLRIFLTALVIVHHTAIPYGGLGNWKFRSRCFPPLSIALAVFNGVDQTFFMGGFFFVSGWFSGIGVERATREGTLSTFVANRFKRLVLPAVLYTVAVNPFLEVMVEGYGPDGFAWESSPMGSLSFSATTFRASLSNFVGIRGPVWYCILLAIFDVSAIFVPPWSMQRLVTMLRKHGFMLSLWITTIIASFVIRVSYPAGRVFRPLNLQPAYLPQYMLAYTLGFVSQETQDLHANLPLGASKFPLPRLICALVCSILAAGVMLYISAIHLSTSDPATAMQAMTGGFNLPAFLYASWNEASFAVILPSLLATFTTYLNKPFLLRTRNNQFVDVARYSYAAFLVHESTSLFLEMLIDINMGCSTPESSTVVDMLGPFGMTLCVGGLNVLASWNVGFLLVENVPWLRAML